MNNQQKRMADELVKEIMKDIREMGCFEPEMIQYVGSQLGKIAYEIAVLEKKT